MNRKDGVEVGVLINSIVIRGAHVAQMNNRGSVPDRSMSLFLACLAYAACVVLESIQTHKRQRLVDVCTSVGSISIK